MLQNCKLDYFYLFTCILLIFKYFYYYDNAAINLIKKHNYSSVLNCNF